MGHEGRGAYRALIAGLDAGQHDRLLRALTEEEAREADWEWDSWAHDGQQPPEARPDGSPWRTWVIMAGRGFGKTLAGAKWITGMIAAQAWGEGAGTEGTGTVTRNCPQPEPLQIALVGATLDEARRVMVEGRSGLLAVADAWVSEWNPTLRRLRFTTGAEATLFSGASPEQLRGPEHHLAWCDELAKWEKPQETWDMLQFGLRLGDWPRALVTTTPRPGPILHAILAESDTVQTGGRTAANPHNPQAWIESTRRLYAGTRLGRQELDGELLTDAPGALWTVELLERCRVEREEGKDLFAQRHRDAEDHNPSPREAAHSRTSQKDGASPECGEGHDLSAPLRLCANPHFLRLVIAVDPPAVDGTCGIIACAKDEEGKAHILADHSVTAQSPEGWSRAVANAVRIHTHLSCSGAGRSVGSSGSGGVQSRNAPASAGAQLTPLVVAEKNQGGAMIRAVLHTADPRLRVKLVAATVGKAERAAPVAMLFEAGRVVLHGRFPELEAELLGMIAGGGYEGPGTSPDRADAMVWGLTELMLGPEKAPPRVRGF